MFTLVHCSGRWQSTQCTANDTVTTTITAMLQCLDKDDWVSSPTQGIYSLHIYFFSPLDRADQLPLGLVTLHQLMCLDDLFPIKHLLNMALKFSTLEFL